ncbi:MAG TPA: ABC transporter ATP-binding protein [Vicinamibacterales bacterium]|jgi:iron complex transport system ATP-binding protein
MTPVLTASNVSFAYDRRGRTIVDGMSLSVNSGAIVGLLGPNGAGKTTLLRLLTGTLTPTAGQIRYQGTPLAQLSRREIARHIAVVPQETHSTFDYSAFDIVMMGRYPHLGAFELEGPADFAIAREAMMATGTLDLGDRPYATLSGGEKQRVVIASALAQAADVLLLDEPTASLDPRFQLEIAELLRRLNGDRQTTMVVSTHDLNFAASICTDLALIRQGRMIAQGSVREVLTRERIRALYDIDADVSMHERAGHLTVVPVGHSD